MVSVQKVAGRACLAGFAVALAVGSASAQDTKIGRGAVLNLDGKVSNQVAFAIGARSTAHNVAGGVTSGGSMSIGDKANITTRARVTGPVGQVAVAGGVGSSAGNNAGGVLTMGSPLSR